MPFCYSNIIFMFRHVYIDHKCQKSQIKKGSSINIGKIKQKLSTQELVYIPTFNICASISSMKYFNYFVVSYISMYIVFRSSYTCEVKLSRQTNTSSNYKVHQMEIIDVCNTCSCMTLSIEKILRAPGLFTYVFINQSKYILQ